MVATAKPVREFLIIALAAGEKGTCLRLNAKRFAQKGISKMKVIMFVKSVKGLVIHVCQRLLA